MLYGIFSNKYLYNLYHSYEYESTKTLCYKALTEERKIVFVIFTTEYENELDEYHWDDIIVYKNITLDNFSIDRNLLDIVIMYWKYNQIGDSVDFLTSVNHPMSKQVSFPNSLNNNMTDLFRYLISTKYFATNYHKSINRNDKQRTVRKKSSSLENLMSDIKNILIIDNSNKNKDDSNKNKDGGINQQQI